MPGQWIELDTRQGEAFKAWLALPSAGPAPAIVLLQEIFGVNAHIRDLAERFAERGYVVIAPDLFWRLEPGIDLQYGEADIAQALSHYQRFDADAALADIGAVVAFLRRLPDCTGRIAAMGYCLGGYLAFRSALECDIQAAVAYYGVGIERHLAGDLRINCPVMIHYAGEDKFIPPDTVRSVVEHFAGNPGVEVFTYQAVDHGFVNHEREAFDAMAASTSDARTFGFLEKSLR